MGGFWVGADPGGIGNFGLAFIGVSGRLRCYTVSSVDEAVKRIAAFGEPFGRWALMLRCGGRLAAAEDAR